MEDTGRSKIQNFGVLVISGLKKIRLECRPGFVDGFQD